eukprot:jgi/Bigna1/126119/aug1.2_g827
MIWAFKVDYSEMNVEKRLEFYNTQSMYNAVLGFKATYTAELFSFGEVFSWELSRKHIWISIFLRPEGDWFNSKQRLTGLLLLIINTIIVSAFMIEQKQEIGALSPEISWIVMTNLLVFPVPFFVFKLFGWRHENRGEDFEDEEKERQIKAVLTAGRIPGMSRSEQHKIKRGGVRVERTQMNAWDEARREEVAAFAVQFDPYAMAGYIVAWLWIGFGLYFVPTISANRGKGTVRIGSLEVDKWVLTIVEVKRDRYTSLTDILSRLVTSFLATCFFICWHRSFRLYEIWKTRDEPDLPFHMKQDMKWDTKNLGMDAKSAMSTRNVFSVGATNGRFPNRKKIIEMAKRAKDGNAHLPPVTLTNRDALSTDCTLTHMQYPRQFLLRSGSTRTDIDSNNGADGAHAGEGQNGEGAIGGLASNLSLSRSRDPNRALNGSAAPKLGKILRGSRVLHNSANGSNLFTSTKRERKRRGRQRNRHKRDADILDGTMSIHMVKGTTENSISISSTSTSLLKSSAAVASTTEAAKETNALLSSALQQHHRSNVFQNFKAKISKSAAGAALNGSSSSSARSKNGHSRSRSHGRRRSISPPTFQHRSREHRHSRHRSEMISSLFTSSGHTVSVLDRPRRLSRSPVAASRTAHPSISLQSSESARSGKSGEDGVDNEIASLPPVMDRSFERKAPSKSPTRRGRHRRQRSGGIPTSLTERRAVLGVSSSRDRSAMIPYNSQICCEFC